ncbi:hypothetical protein DL95DRAFT_109904 [Leptodontidium sp. 2 PMI_412]|nr:hypothetical protein DL95DRAFT_109904 [Leptodontidium sp. 2 PMI_412]
MSPFIPSPLLSINYSKEIYLSSILPRDQHIPGQVFLRTVSSRLLYPVNLIHPSSWPPQIPE